MLDLAKHNVGFPSEIDGLGRCFFLAYLQAADITDFVVLTFLDITQLAGFGEHRPEHANLIRAIAKRELVFKFTKTTL